MNIMRTLSFTILIFIVAALCSCASREVISKEVKAESERVSFKTLVQETDRHKGKTVILGGYILETKNIAGVANMTVLQTPLGRDEKPVSQGRSEGGFILSYNGHLEPEVYEKGRRTTVAGKLAGRADEGAANCPKPCLKLEYRQIYLWPMYESPSYLSYEEDRGTFYERHPYGY
ncbi:MAG: Slp family lipoprotein [Deltaproteobacteria bacterium]|nr:MAG: Slp family lipoprotein [Deltaproteobacteria bacterium]